MGIKKRSTDEQWITLRQAGANAVDANVDAAFAEFAYVIGNIHAELAAAGTTGTAIADVNKGGATIFNGATKLSFASGSVSPTYDTLAAGMQTGSKGDKFSLDVDAKHTTAGENLVVMIQLLKSNKGSSGKTLTNVAPSALR